MKKEYVFHGMIHRVIDGDTYDIILDLGFYISHMIRVRLKGVDTPEIYGESASEAGKAASEYVKNLLDNKKVTIKTYKNSPSAFNRWEADVFFDHDFGGIASQSTNLAEHLVEKGYAKKV